MGSVSNATKPATIVSSQKAGSKQRTTMSGNGKRKPVVYKRERLKLRATISPAILEQLQQSSQEESGRPQVNEDVNSNIALTTSTPQNTSKKGIAWHHKQVTVGLTGVIWAPLTGNSRVNWGKISV